MKKLIYLFLLLKLTTLSAQIDSKYLVNDWYLTKSEMKDGSRIFVKPLNYLDNYGFRFTKKTYSFNDIQRLEENNGFPITYLLKKNELWTSPGSSLVIEKLTTDSLIIVQKIENMEDKDLLRYYLVPLKKVRQNRFDELKGSDTLLASKILGPVFKNGLRKGTIRTIDEMHPVTTSQVANYRFNGTLLFDLEKKSVVASLKNFDNNFKRKIEEKLQFLTTPKNWNFSGADGFKYAKIDFAFIHYYKMEGQNESFGDIYNLYSNDFEDVFITEKTGLADVEESNKFFNFAISAFQKKNYQEALSFFEKSFTNNNRNLNAYYNFAAINYSLGNIEKACKTYKFLKEEGQKSAEKIYIEKCQK